MPSSVYLSRRYFCCICKIFTSNKRKRKEKNRKKSHVSAEVSTKTSNCYIAKQPGVLCITLEPVKAGKKMLNITQKTLQNLHRKWNKDEYFKGCWTEFAVFSLYTPPQLPTDLRGEHRDIPTVVCVGRAERNVLFKQKPHRQHKTELYFAAVLLFVSYDWAVPTFGGSSKDSGLKTLAQPGGQAPPGVTTAPSLNTSK